jgi:hypothetical protein
MRIFRSLAATFVLALLAGCGLYVPAKDPLKSDTPDPIAPYHTSQGDYENKIVAHMVCEIANGLAAAQSSFALPWLGSSKWGTSVTLTITAQEQSGLNPGVSLTKPIHNVVTPFPVGGSVVSSQSISLGLGGSISANATRTETIQFTFLNSALLLVASNYPSNCAKFEGGPMIDGDLEIRQFIYDKAQIARMGNASLYNGKPYDPATAWKWPVYNTFTEQINFIATLSGNITPTWKLARFATTSSPNLLSAQRTYTNQLIITIGPVGTPPSNDSPATLSASAQNQHNAQVNAGAFATSIQGSTNTNN